MLAVDSIDQKDWCAKRDVGGEEGEGTKGLEAVWKGVG